jgi:hypothetical protein
LCEPDFNAWAKTVNDSPNMGLDIRCVGGHIHVGYDSPTQKLNERIIKFMDLYLGVPSVILDSASKDRRLLYGKAGCFRNKPYGVEYRSLSNFWAFERKYINWVFDTVDFVTKDLVLNYSIKFTEEMEKNIVNCINNSDVELAKKICAEFSIELPSLEEKFESKYESSKAKGKSDFQKYVESSGIQYEVPTPNVIDTSNISLGILEEIRQRAIAYTTPISSPGIYIGKRAKAKVKSSSEDTLNF